MAKRQKKEKAHKNRSKEGLRTGVYFGVILKHSMMTRRLPAALGL